MKVLILDMDAEATALDMALRAQDADHDVRYWLPPHQGTGKTLPFGEGMLPRVVDWEGSVEWADLIVANGNSRSHTEIADLIGRGYPVFATNEKAAQLELEREVGQQVLEDHGIETLPYTVVKSIDEAITHIAKTDTAYAIKPYGGTADKAMTAVPSTPEDAIFILQKWQEQGKSAGGLMLQEKVDGIEMGISGWFGPGGWCAALEEAFEFKRLMNDDLGCNTGEQGTVIRHVTDSKLFDQVLEPLTDYLQQIGYVGDASVNCIIGADGTPYPLEFTMRFGIPDIYLRYELLKADPVGWMLDLLQGKDSYIVSPDIALGVVLSHGDYPKGKDPLGTWQGYPIRGVSADNKHHVHYCMVCRGTYPTIDNGVVKERRGIVTAGNYPMVVTGAGKSVSAAQRATYATIDEIDWPSDLMYRTDIGARLKEQLPLLQKHGYAEGMKY